MQALSKNFIAAAALAGMIASSSFAGTVTLEDNILTLSGLVTNVVAEADLGASVTQVVITAEGGVAFGATLAVEKYYVVNGTGIVSVATGKKVSTPVSRLSTVGSTFVKDGPGTLYISSGTVGNVAKPTRWVVNEGELRLKPGGSFFGGHSNTTNLSIELREGTTYYQEQTDVGTTHNPMGLLEMTGARFIYAPSRYVGTVREGNAAFKGGVTVHASATPSYMTWPRYSHLNHVNPDCVFNIEDGGTLIVDGVLTNGANASWSGDLQSVLTKRGGGELVLLRRNGWTGGTIFEDGAITVVDAEALGKSTLTIAGDVTINVPAGVTFICPPLVVDGTHTLAVTGGGVFVQPASVPEGLTIANNTEGVASTLVGSTLYLMGGTITLPVASDMTITSMVDDGSGLGKYTDIVKTGAGTLTLPTGIAETYHNLIVKEGLVAVSAESCFGWGGTTVNGGGIRYTANITQTTASRPITYVGSGTIDIPEGVTWAMRSNSFACASAVVTKTGMGRWQLNTYFQPALCPVNNARWIVHEGTLGFASGGDFFGGHMTSHNLTIEVHEDGVFKLYEGGFHHLPTGSVFLRGGTLWGSYAQFSGDAQSVAVGSTWKGWGLNGPITALPSQNGKPSRICARVSHLKHGTASSTATTFDVRNGAVLEIDAALQPGNSGTLGNLVKTGGGTLKLLKPCGAKGLIDIREGTVELAAGVRFDPVAMVGVAPDAKLVLGDRAQVANTVDLASALCASADVWLDASRLSLMDGAAVNSVRNLGTAGGEFAKFTWTTTTYGRYKSDSTATRTGQIPAVPKFKASGINGMGVLNFNGVQALCLPSYTNKTGNLKVFYVAQWTSWTNQGGVGKWGGPMSFGNQNMTGDDNGEAGVLTYQHWDSSSVTPMVTLTKGATPSVSTAAVGTPYLVSSYLTRTGIGSTVYVNDSTTPLSKSATLSNPTNVNVEFVCVGGRTCKNGGPQVWSDSPWSGGPDRMYIGYIGEMLAFTRTLTAAEEEQILAYLKRKWFNSSVEVTKEAEKALAKTVRIEVPEGAEASYVASVADNTGGASSFDMTKTGAGTLRYGGAVAGGAIIDVEAGGLKLKDGSLPSQVDVWVDAADASTMTFDAGNRVTNLVNKGSAGGSFVRNARRSPVPYGPTVKEGAEGMNGNPVLAFDGNEALVLNSYTNYTSPREFYLYMVKRRMKWELNEADATNGAGHGKWASPFALGSATAPASDENVPGVIHVSESSATAYPVDLGNGALNGDYAVAAPALGAVEIFYLFNTSNGCFGAVELEATSTTAVPRKARTDMKGEPLAIDLVQIGGRLMKNGQAQWYGEEIFSNRMWYGDIAEMIITTMPLGQGQEDQLLAYLRKKWMNKGTGSTTPPAWLAGMPATAVTDADTSLMMANGTTLEHEAATKTLGALATEGTVDWTRVWDGATTSSFQLFSVAGDVSLGAVNLTANPKPTDATVMDWTGTLVNPATWSLLGEGSSSAKITLRATDKAYVIVPVGTILLVR